jgi:hypothetical protein
MTEETVQREWHHFFAVEAFNRAWDLIDQPKRSPEQEQELLQLAFTSRWHWGRIGGAEQIATGDWQVALAASRIGMADLALRFAASGLAVGEANGFRGWRLASLHEGMARACAGAGDEAGYEHHRDACTAALAEEPDPSNRELIESQLGSIPSPART